MARTKEYEKTVRSFSHHEADILVGTQILAKGLDFPSVSLVGIVNADTGLNLPDFRASERTFQLLCQVEGRAGRGLVPGHAVIQTYNPENYAIKYAALHDYAGFYQHEIEYRRSFGYPPFSRMARMVYSHYREEKCRGEAERVAGLVRTKIAETGEAGFKLIGPAPAFIARLRRRFQMQLIIVGQEVQDIIKDMELPNGWILDVDPVGMV